PEQEIDLTKTYPGKTGATAAWKEYPSFQLGQMNNLALFPKNVDACVYLFHEFTAAEEKSLPVALGSDDTITVWLNGQRRLAQNSYRVAAPDQERITLLLKPGKNQFLIKVCQGGGKWEVYVCPAFPPKLETMFGKTLQRDFAF